MLNKTFQRPDSISFAHELLIEQQIMNRKTRRKNHPQEVSPTQRELAIVPGRHGQWAAAILRIFRIGNTPRCGTAADFAYQLPAWVTLSVNWRQPSARESLFIASHRQRG
ncbi:MAG: hypothetical protein ACLGSD_11765 [Acidobacteriota bacterium]